MTGMCRKVFSALTLGCFSDSFLLQPKFRCHFLTSQNVHDSSQCHHLTVAVPAKPGSSISLDFFSHFLAAVAIAEVRVLSVLNTTNSVCSVYDKDGKLSIRLDVEAQGQV